LAHIWRHCLGALVLLALTACYGSDPALFAPSQFDRPLTPGAYETKDGPMRVTLGRGGWYVARFKDDSTGRFGLVPLGPASARRYLVVMQDEEVAWYLLAEFESSRSVRLALPSCNEEADRKLALAAGAVDSGPQMVRSCHFPDRRAVMQAMSAYAGAEPKFEQWLRRR
jgi:hypothetical protein